MEHSLAVMQFTIRDNDLLSYKRMTTVLSIDRSPELSLKT